MGFVGRMHGGKGVAQLMQAANEAMRTNPRLHALWVGNGPEESALHRMADQGGFSTRHHFTGWVADTARYHRAFSFLAFPSVELETFGRVSIEAQACGVPVLGSHIGGVPETLRDGVTGFLIKPGDIAAWRDRILALCDETLCAEMGIAARAHVVDHFSNAAVARDFELLLRYGDEVLHHYEHAPT
jgi:glycosyltransferase involved in cell wall biosynthesis